MAKKIALDDRSWFYNLYIKGMRNFNAESDVGLYVVNIGYPLSLGVSAYFDGRFSCFTS